jgi:hypothetical protein
MNQAEVFCLILGRNQDFIMKTTEGLSQAESVLQLPGESNCMNWILGHVAVYRDVMLTGILQPEHMSADDVKLYAYDSKPITAKSNSVRLDRLVKLLAQGYETLTQWLQSNPEGLLALPPQTIDLDTSYGSTAAEKFAFLCWHESNHVGELHALREVALVSLGKGWN